MKKKFLSILLTLVLALSLCLVTAVPVMAADLRVGEGQPYDTIQAAINAAGEGDTIIVAAGTYAPFTVASKTNLTIQSNGVVIVEGAQSVPTAYTDRDCVVFVDDSTGIVLDGLDIQGVGLGTTNPKNYGVIYENSTGEIKGCTVSPNTISNMLSIAIGIWDGSEVTVDTCTIENFGRVGMLIYNGCTVEVLDSTIIGQVYSGVDEVSYGIEVEGAFGDATPETASHVTITGNEIYNCDNPSSDPGWESAGILINGWLEHMDAADSTVIMENNDIHDNYIGIYAVKSPSSYAYFNNIYDNRVYGVISAPLLWTTEDTTAVFDATMNWWGATNGPSGVGPGDGDAVSVNVDFTPWLLGLWTGSAVGLTVDNPQIVAISVTPTSIDFGTLSPGSESTLTTLTISNIGSVDVRVDTSIDETGSFFTDNLYLTHPKKAIDYFIDPLTVGGSPATPSAQVVVPSTYPAVGEITGTLIFIATPK